MKRWIAACALVATAAAAQTTAPPKENFVALEGPLLALTHVEVFDGTGAAPLKDATILVRDGRIAAFGAFADVKVPAEAKVVDLSGHSITPGLVMLHEHMFYPLVQGSYGAMFETCLLYTSPSPRD